jgi:hypothetical protein
MVRRMGQGGQCSACLGPMERQQLEVGYKPGLNAVDLDSARTLPVHGPRASLAYAPPEPMFA